MFTPCRKWQMNEHFIPWFTSWSLWFGFGREKALLRGREFLRGAVSSHGVKICVKELLYNCELITWGKRLPSLKWSLVKNRRYPWGCNWAGTSPKIIFYLYVGKSLVTCKWDNYNEVRHSTLMFISGNCVCRESLIWRDLLSILSLYETAPISRGQIPGAHFTDKHRSSRVLEKGKQPSPASHRHHDLLKL